MKREKIVRQVTWRYLMKNRRQTLIAYTGIVLMTLLMTCVFVGRDTIVSYLTKATENQYGKWHMAVYNIRQEQYEALIKKDYVGEFALSRNQELSNFAQSANNQRPFINVREYSEQTFDWQTIKLTEGELPKNDREIVISKEVLTDGSSVKIGDKIEISAFKRLIENFGSGETVFPFLNFTLEAGKTTEAPLSFPFFDAGSSFFDSHRESHESTGFEQAYTVVGFIEAPTYETPSNAAYTGLTLFNPDSQVSQTFNLSFRIPPNYPSRILEIKEELTQMGIENVEVNNKVLSISSISSDSTINTLVAVVQVFFVGLIGLVSIVLIYNIFNLSYDERARYLAMLTSVGATSKQKRSSIYFEVIVLLIAALPLGFLLGLGVIYISMMLMLPTLSAFMAQGYLADLASIPLQLKISILSVLMILVSSVLTVLISAFLPARKISRVGTIETLRGNHNVSKNKKKYKSLLAHSQPVKMLARGFLRYQKTKSRSIVRALAAFIMILIVVSYGSQAVIKMVHYKLSDNVVMTPNHMNNAEYRIMGNSEAVADVREMREQLTKIKGISDVCTTYQQMWAAETEDFVYDSGYFEAHYKVMREYYPENWTFEDYKKRYEKERFNFVSILSVDDSVFDDIVKKVDGQVSSTDSLPLVVYQKLELSTSKTGIWGQTARQYQFFEVSPATSLKVGSNIPLKFVDAEATMKNNEVAYNVLEGQVVGLGSAEDLAPWVTVHDESIWVITKNSSFDDLAKKINKSGDNITVAFTADESQPDVAKLIRELKQLENDMITFVESKNQRALDFKVIIASLIQFIMVAFIILTSIVCGLNLYNSISGLMLTRRRNFVILKSLGITRQQISRMVRKEFYVIFLQSILSALPFTVLACWLIQTLFVQRFGRFSIGFPIYTLVIILLVFGLILGCLHWYCMKNDKESLMETIRSEVV